MTRRQQRRKQDPTPGAPPPAGAPATRVAAVAAAVAESGWLTALVAVPVLFNPYSERVFEEPKILLLRSIAALILGALIIWWIETSRGRAWSVASVIWQIPLAGVGLFYAAVVVISTAASISPRTSFWGAYLRLQGTATWLCYAVISVAIIALVRHRSQVDRIVTAMILASIPVALYGVLQAAGQDPIPWGTDFKGRVFGTGGHPSFTAALIVMVIPLTCARLLAHITRLRQATWGRAFPLLLGCGVYLVVFLLQLGFVVVSQSRGSFLALGTAACSFGILHALRSGRRSLARCCAGLAGAAVVALLALNLHAGLRGRIDQVPYLGRLTHVFDTTEGNATGRLLMWRGVVDLVASNPIRAIIGHGPETMFDAFAPFQSVDFRRYEMDTPSVDRAHNELLDRVVAGGLLGGAAHVALFLALFYHLLRWLGLIPATHGRWRFLGGTVGMGGAGVLLAYLIDGGLRFAALGFGAGCTVGLILFLLICSAPSNNGNSDRARSDGILIAIFAAAIARFVDGQFGIPVAPTELYFWVAAALAVVVGASFNREAAGNNGTAQVKTSRPNHAARRAAPIPGNGHNVIVLAGLVGISVVILTFSLDTSSIRSEHKGAAYLLIGGVWILAAALVALESALEPATRRSAADLVVFGAVSGGLWSGFYLLHGALREWAVPAGVSGAELVRHQALHIANSIPVLYGYCFASLAVLALVVWNRARGATRLCARWTAVAGLVPIAIALALVAGASVDASRADVVSKIGTSIRSSGRWMEAEALYREALRLRPSEDSYKVKLGLALSELGRGPQGREEERIRRLEAARALLEEALIARPMSIDALANLAALHRIWSGAVTAPAEQARQFDLAESYYRRALERVPQRTALWNAWAATALERGDPTTAFTRLERSFALDPDKAESHVVRGFAHLQAGAYDKSVADYDRALVILPTIQGAREPRALAWSRLTLAKQGAVKPPPEMP